LNWSFLTLCSSSLPHRVRVVFSFFRLPAPVFWFPLEVIAQVMTCLWKFFTPLPERSGFPLFFLYLAAGDCPEWSLTPLCPREFFPALLSFYPKAPPVIFAAFFFFSSAKSSVVFFFSLDFEFLLFLFDVVRYDKIRV